MPSLQLYRVDKRIEGYRSTFDKERHEFFDRLIFELARASLAEVVVNCRFYE